jgi:pyruvate/2-oxoglutarate/acetoin dehydrogenase E1 component
VTFARFPESKAIIPEILPDSVACPSNVVPVIQSFRETIGGSSRKTSGIPMGSILKIVTHVYQIALDVVNLPIQKVAHRDVPLAYNREAEDVLKGKKEVL